MFRFKTSSFVRNEFDKILLFTVAGLVLFGIIILYSATAVRGASYGDGTLYYVKKQLLALAIGLLGATFAYRTDLSLLERHRALFLILSILLIILPLVPYLGISGGGASRWISVFGINFQPVELSKLVFVVYLSAYISKYRDSMDTLEYGMLRPVLLLVILCSILLFQPDFGSAAIIAVITFIMLFVGGARFTHIFACLFSGLLLAIAAVVASPYRMNRLLAFMDPLKDAQGKGYQLLQALIALGSGGLFGRGLGGGLQKLYFLPASHTDFIYAVLGEELGFVGCLSILLLFLVIFWRGIVISLKVKEKIFLSLLSVGLTCLIVIPAIVNLGVVVGLLPTKGLVLPLVSYGGSNLVVSMISIGLLLNVSKEAVENG